MHTLIKCCEILQHYSKMEKELQIVEWCEEMYNQTLPT